jgi:hypothetical protein
MSRRFLRAGLWIGGGVAMVGALGAGLLYAMVQHFNPSAPETTYPHPASALEAQRQDLDYFRKLIALDRAFTPAARAEAGRRIASLEKRPAALDRPHFRVALMRIGALADNGHSKVGYDDAANPKELPVRVAIFSDGLYVMRTTHREAALLGGRVVSIDGQSIDSVIARLGTLRGGTPQWKKAYASMYLPMQDMLYGAGIAPDMSHSTWTVVAPSGDTVARILTAYTAPKGEPYVFIKRWFSSEPLKGMTKGWQVYQPDRPLPITLRDYDTNFRRVRLPGSCAMLLQFKSNADENGQSISEFISATEADMAANKPCNAILDLRFDDGGNYMTTYGFANRLPGLIAPGGRIYMLTGPSTFSAGITTAAFLKQAGGQRVSILGEPVGDRLHFFSEGGRGCLPNYALCVSYETGKHDYQNACTDLDVCFWPNYWFAVRVKSLDPDETITQSFADWRAGRDPVFERAFALAKTTPKS